LVTRKPPDGEPSWWRGIELDVQPLENLMADDLKQRAPQDASRISLNEDWVVRYWAKTLGVSREELENLVRQHGNSAEPVRKALTRAV
jgi:hypothetical protein